MRDYIFSGLKNAIEHGTPIDRAVQSFINAGYNPSEVKQAAEYLQQGVMPIVEQKPQIPMQQTPPQKTPYQTPQTSPVQKPFQNPLQIQPKPLPTMQIAQQPQMQQPMPIQTPQAQQTQQVEQKKGISGTVIFLIVLLLVLLGALAALILFKERILDFILK